MITPTTKLSAINIMLETIGSAPIASIDDGVRNEDAIVAESVLDQVVKELQAEEWHFNTEYDYPLTPDVNGKIRVPATITRIRPVAEWHGPIDVTIRGSWLYDRGNHTYTFDKEFPAVVILCLDFEELPSEAKLYTTIRAARKFAAISQGDTNNVTWTQQDEARLRAAFISADARQDSRSLGLLHKADPVIGIELSRL